MQVRRCETLIREFARYLQVNCDRFVVFFLRERERILVTRENT